MILQVEPLRECPAVAGHQLRRPLGRKNLMKYPRLQLVFLLLNKPALAGVVAMPEATLTSTTHLSCGLLNGQRGAGAKELMFHAASRPIPDYPWSPFLGSGQSSLCPRIAADTSQYLLLSRLEGRSFHPCSSQTPAFPRTKFSL